TRRGVVHWSDGRVARAVPRRLESSGQGRGLCATSGPLFHPFGTRETRRKSFPIHFFCRCVGVCVPVGHTHWEGGRDRPGSSRAARPWLPAPPRDCPPRPSLPFLVQSPFRGQ